jgi:hypothetical protein
MVHDHRHSYTVNPSHSTKICTSEADKAFRGRHLVLLLIFHYVTVLCFTDVRQFSVANENFLMIFQGDKAWSTHKSDLNVDCEPTFWKMCGNWLNYLTNFNTKWDLSNLQRTCRSWGGYSSASHCPDHVMWDLWWTKRQCGRFSQSTWVSHTKLPADC